MSSFKRLAIRTKKSLSGIYSSIGDGDQKSHQQEVAAGRPLTTTSPVPEAPNIEGFRTFGDGSPAPGKDSPSKRKRLLGSLRSVGSMRSLRSSFTKPDEEPSAIPEAVKAPTNNERPSLSLIFEASPFDQQIFEPKRKSLLNCIRTDSHRPSPLTAPNYIRDSVLRPASAADFTVGSLAESSAPLQKFLDSETTFTHMYDDATAEQPIFRSGIDGTPPTPMPGTNLAMDEDLVVSEAPDILLCAPSESMGKPDNIQSYFNIPIASSRKVSGYTNSIIVTDCSTINDHERFAATSSTDFDITNSRAIRSSPKLKPVYSKESSIPDITDDHFTLDTDDDVRKSLETKNDMVRAYLALDGKDATEENQCQLKLCQSTWGRHSGLYDSTGYGDEETSLPTPLPESGVSEDGTLAICHGIIYEDSIKENVEDTTQSAKAGAEPHEGTGGTLVFSSSPSQQEERSPVDEGEALHEVILAYAAPMYEDEIREAQAHRFQDRLSHDDVESLSKDFVVEIQADVVESVRIMNRSLGG